LKLSVSCVHIYVVDRELEQGRIAALNWAEADMTMQLQMIWHKERWLSPALRAFLEVVREQLPVTPELATTA
jgi:DNA-binding transcriptional LysR family regulator